MSRAVSTCCRTSAALLQICLVGGREWVGRDACQINANTVSPLSVVSTTAAPPITLLLTFKQMHLFNNLRQCYVIFSFLNLQVWSAKCRYFFRMLSKWFGVCFKPLTKCHINYKLHSDEAFALFIFSRKNLSTTAPSLILLGVWVPCGWLQCSVSLELHLLSVSSPERWCDFPSHCDWHVDLLSLCDEECRAELSHWPPWLREGPGRTALLVGTKEPRDIALFTWHNNDVKRKFNGKTMTYFVDSVLFASAVRLMPWPRGPFGRHIDAVFQQIRPTWCSWVLNGRNETDLV